MKTSTVFFWIWDELKEKGNIFPEENVIYHLWKYTLWLHQVFLCWIFEAGLS